jgi:8-oxo-dGTP diphosphatase
MTDEIRNVYGNKVRVRVCGLAFYEDKLLMINHRSLTRGAFWAPPGGGVDFGQTATETLVREFLEETGLQVAVRDFLFVCEFIHQPLHAIELFFNVKIEGGTLQKGTDPETREQLIHELKFISQAELHQIPPAGKHGIFTLCPCLEEP